MTYFSDIFDLTEEIIAIFLKESIGGIDDIKLFRLTSELKKDPIVKRFFTLTNDLIEIDTSTELVYRVFEKLEDLFLCIIKGYYSTNNLDLIQRISDFLDVVIGYSVGIPGAVMYYMEHDEEFLLDYYSLIEEEFKDININIENKQLRSYLRNLDDFNGFILNIEKVYEDRAYKQYFFQNHIRQCYDDRELNELLKEHPIFSLRINQLDLQNLRIKAIHDIEGLNTIRNLKYLDLSNNPLSDLSGIENFPNLEILKINNANISKIDILKNLSELRILEFNNNKVIEINGLATLSKLEVLQLEKNNIKEIESIRNLENLIKLNLRDNNISDIDCLYNMMKLRELDLIGNKICKIENVDFLTRIKKLYIDPLESYLSEEESQALRHIEVIGRIKFKIFDNLTIEGNNVIHLKVKLIASTEIIKEIKKLRKLKKLEFSLKNLSNFPKEICELSTLEELNLSDNKFVRVPDSIINLKQLKKLDLSYNRLTSFPLALVRLDSLEFLDLSYNRIKQLPKAIGNFKSLITMILQGNELVKIPQSIKNIKILRKINLKGNDFYTEPPIIRKLKDQGIEVLITYIP